MPVICMVIVGILRKFHRGDSTAAQRTWTISWLILGNFFGVFIECYGFMLVNHSAHHCAKWLRKALLEAARGVLPGEPIAKHLRHLDSVTSILELAFRVA